ncbi:MAG: 3-oxoacyl-[acyl-carrier protein] reductase [Methylobacteriaceae bacterium]|jgi:3-oxoacyl-[acyl-carrier protein] reductase|nr:3-oxoacyl-[acyl-carrier protein] reductase [Methylobacteriaceae bacterium]
MRLDGKVALVTGAARGFGAGIAEVFAREGARLVLTDIDRAGIGKIAQSVGGDARGLAADVTDAGDWQKAVDACLQDFGRLDIVVNNAGTSHRNQPLLSVPEAEFDRVFAVNVKSIYLSAQAAVPVMRQKGGGVFINIGSTAALRPRPGLAWYNGTKGAVHAISRTMAVELAPDKIRVCVIAPVAGETPLLEMFMGEDTAERRAAFVAPIPLGRFSTPRDVANAALFLASDEAAFLTGNVVEVDGGRCV